MAVLTNQARADASAEYQRTYAPGETVSGVTRADIRAAFNAIDDLMFSSETTINNAFPVATRNGLTTAQKARLLMAVVAKRYLTGA